MCVYRCVHLADDDAPILHVIDKFEFVLNMKRKQPKRTQRGVWNVKQSEARNTAERRLIRILRFPSSFVGWNPNGEGWPDQS